MKCTSIFEYYKLLINDYPKFKCEKACDWKKRNEKSKLLLLFEARNHISANEVNNIVI